MYCKNRGRYNLGQTRVIRHSAASVAMACIVDALDRPKPACPDDCTEWQQFSRDLPFSCVFRKGSVGSVSAIQKKEKQPLKRSLNLHLRRLSLSYQFKRVQNPCSGIQSICNCKFLTQPRLKTTLSQRLSCQRKLNSHVLACMSFCGFNWGASCDSMGERKFDRSV